MQLLFFCLVIVYKLDYMAALGKITSARQPVSVSHEANEYMVKIGKAALIRKRNRKKTQISLVFSPYTRN